MALKISDVKTDRIVDSVSDHISQNSITGLIDGGILSINVDNTKFDISDGHGHIVVSPNVHGESKVINVEWEGLTAITPTYLTTEQRSFIGIDTDGKVYQKSSKFTDTEYRQYIFLGRLIHIGKTTISSVATSPILAYNVGDVVMDYLNHRKIKGVLLSANGANLSVDLSAGEGFLLSVKYASTPLSPNIISIGAVSVKPVYHAYEDNNGDHQFLAGDPTNFVDPTRYYDRVADELKSVSPAKFTISRFLYYPGSGILIQIYGEEEFLLMDDAEEVLADDGYVNTIDNFEFGAWQRSYLIVKQNCTDLSDTALAKFIGIGFC